jgi:hypothetical protein
MPTFQTQLLNEVGAGHDGPAIPESKRVYFQERLRSRVFDFIVSKFISEQKKGLNKNKLSRRIGKDPKVINRWLAAPSNLTLDTISDLLIGICAEEPDLSGSPLINRTPINYSHLDDDLKTEQVERPSSAKDAMFKDQERGSRKAAVEFEKVEQKIDQKSALCN